MTAFLQLLLVLLLQSTALLLLGLLALHFTHRRGPVVQTLVGRASLTSVALLALLLPLTGHIQPVVRVSPPAPILGSRSLEPVALVAVPLPQRNGAEVGAAGADTQGADVKGAETQGASRSAPTLPAALPPTPTTPRFPASEGQALALGGFLSVSTILLLWLGVCQWHLTRLRRTAGAITTGPALDLLAALTPNPPCLLTHPSVSSPFLAGYRRPIIFLPLAYAVDFDADALRAIFVHELAHRDRRDNLWTLTARLLTSLLWPQPLLWLLVRRLEHISEDACDEAVLAQNCPSRAYADCLLSLASRPPLHYSQRTLNVGVAPFRSSVGRRISRILTTKGTPLMSPITLRLRLAAAALTIAAALSGAFLVSSAPAQTTTPTPFVPTPQEQQFIAEYKQDLLNLKEIGQANIQYLQDHNEHFPDAARWMDELSPYLKDKTVFLDPFQPGQNRYGYAFNRNCSDKPTSAFSAPSETVVVFDSTLRTRNASDTGQSLRINPPSSSRINSIGSGYGFVDGHAKWMRPEVHPLFALDGGASRSLGAATSQEQAGRQFTGRVVYENGQPAPGVVVDARLTSSSIATLTRRGQKVQDVETGAEATTQADGSYRLRNLTAGCDYDIIEREASSEWVARAIENVPLSQATTHVPNLVLTHGAVITGTVTNKKTQQPMPDMSVYSLGPRYPASMGGSSSTRTDANGEYSLRVVPGDNWIYISGTDANADYVTGQIGVSPMSTNLKYPQYEHGFHVVLTKDETKVVPIYAILPASPAHL